MLSQEDKPKICTDQLAIFLHETAILRSIVHRIIHIDLQLKCFKRRRARTNNLTLNRNKSKEVVFSDPRRRRQIEPPPPTTDIARVTSLKILGVTTTNGPSASGHVRDVIRSCAQTLYALRVLRAYGMCHAALQAIFRSVAIAKLLYLSSACLDLIHQSD